MTSSSVTVGVAVLGEKVSIPNNNDSFEEAKRHYSIIYVHSSIPTDADSIHMAKGRHMRAVGRPCDLVTVTRDAMRVPFALVLEDTPNMEHTALKANAHACIMHIACVLMEWTVDTT